MDARISIARMKLSLRRSRLGSRTPRLVSSLALALVTALASNARAELHPDAAATIERYLAATGGRAARENEQTARFKGRIEAIGLTGTWELRLAAPDRWVREMKLGSLRIREGFDGTVAWRTDLSGKNPQSLSQEAVVQAREEGWFLNERWTLADLGGARIQPRSRVYGASGDYDVIEVTPPVGRPRRFFVNVKTGFIERVVGEHDHQTVEDRPGEYRMLGGRKRASVYASPTFLPTDKPVERVTVDSVWTNVRYDSARFAAPVAAERVIAWKKSGGTVRVPFHYDSKSVVVKVSINGAPPADFILDTGASLTAIDPTYADAIGLKPEGNASIQGIAASGGMRFARVRTIAVGGAKGSAATLQDFQAGLVELSQGSRIVMWRNTVGLLGADFLSHFAVEIDYDSCCVKFHDPERFTGAGAGEPIPFEIHSGIPVVSLSVNGNCSGKFIVDVGNAFNFVIHGSMVRSCDLIRRNQRKQVEVMGGGIGGGFVSSLCRLDSLRIGPYGWTEPVAALALHRSGGIGSEDFAGNIGNSVLEKFRCTFDYANRKLYLAPGVRYGQRERVSRFGAMLARWGGTVYAGNILSGSAAYEAGLRWYDEILEIDEKPLARWTREEVDRVLEEGEIGAVHRVKYRRYLEGEKIVEVSLKDVL